MKVIQSVKLLLDDFVFKLKLEQETG